ncbi:Evolutionarily conserved signaling intermediate in Toll pathway mitochondrial [Fasciolopsis buskii]|uniref:Evolutionarily conserved signaling intermediate in Toll pathway mitochondrial n=1 Tax=Fasciolopsis buskii TaxID=27845 RepID=A0A8E0S2P0_9TREM|nr:Evolutionarily conserved signaling intermediate in Toll pathway mitochondrial [Fasciolopsis buski]
MSAYEVQDDLDCYKAIIQLFPTGRMTVTTFLQAEWNHFPRQQKTMVQILQQMTENHVLPDDEVGQMIIDIFGWRNHAMQHYRHLMYWMPKLAHANPFPVLLRIVDELDENPIYLAHLIAERISPDRMTKFQLIQLNSEDVITGQPTSLVSAQSPEQQALLSYCATRASANTESGSALRPEPVIYLDGPNFVWYRTLQAAYYTLWTELDRGRLEKEKIRVHRRESWIKHKTLMELPQLGHNALPIDRQLDPVPKLPKSSIQALRLSETVELPVDKTAFLDPKHVLATQGSAQLTTSEPEYDNRWLSLRRSHEYCFLPNELTIHEQGEGTILAVGVVTPTEDALENQKIRFTHDGPLVTSTEAIDLSTLPPVPKLAPEQLLRLWLTQLDKNNPGLSQATLVMRTLNPKSESTNSDPGHSDPTSHTDDENEPQTQAYRF